VVVANLGLALNVIYGVQVDVLTLCRFVQYVSSSSETFLMHLYGLRSDQIQGMREIDMAVEAVARSRSARYVKGKDVDDQHRRLRLTLLQKMHIDSEWMFQSTAE